MTDFGHFATKSTLTNCFRSEIPQLTEPTGRSLCAAAISSIGRFLLRRRTWDEPPHLVAS